MMKKIYLWSIASVLLLAIACKEEQPLTPSSDLGFQERFSPAADALPRVKQLFDDYGVWLRMDFTDAKEVTNAILAQDPSNRFGATPIDDNMKESAGLYVQNLLSNVSADYVKRVFPREFFFVKTYNGSFWAADIFTLGRTRLIVAWPNQRVNTQPITVPETHYYQDSVLTRMVWSSLSSMLSQRMEEEIPGFEDAGVSYDNGKAVDELNARYPNFADRPLLNAELAKLAAERGFIAASGSRGYQQDAAQWIQLLVTESEANITRDYLNTSEKRKAKYKVITEYLKQEYGWDIQATGNKYRQQLDSFN